MGSVSNSSHSLSAAFLSANSFITAGRVAGPSPSLSLKRPRLTSRPLQSVRCSSSTSNRTESKDDEKPLRNQQTHVSAEFGVVAMTHAIALASGDVNSVAKTCAQGVVQAFVQCYNQDDVTCIFVVCGPGLNGLIGMHSAIELKNLGYYPSVYSAGENKYGNVVSMCEQNGIEVFDFVPSTLEFQFQVVIDALLGLGYDGGDIRPIYWDIYDFLVSTRLAVVSVDVPSGWDLEKGPRAVDFTADTFIKPEVLVSLGAPKNGVKTFAGGFHFLAGRHLPQKYFEERNIRVARFPGEDARCVLISSNPFRFRGFNGEVYGGKGFNATLYTKNPRREWVDVEEDMDLWDELD